MVQNIGKVRVQACPETNLLVDPFHVPGRASPCNKNPLAQTMRPCYKGSIMARSSTSFRPKWKLGNTTVIRVPHALAPAVLQYAHDLDEKTEPDELKEPALAYRTAEDVEMTTPVNVASGPEALPVPLPRRQDLACSIYPLVARP